MPAYEPPPKYSEFLQRMLLRARESLGEEFRGITADGIVRPGLFPVRKTGVSLEPILRAAGVVADLIVFEGQSHAQYLFVPDAPEAKEYFTEVTAFFDRHLEK